MKKLCFIFLLLVMGMYQNAQAQIVGYTGEIRLFAGTFAPKGWAFCDGKIMAIKHNSALYSLLGNQYGGDGSTTFALPDLRGRVPMAVESPEVGKTEAPQGNQSIKNTGTAPVIIQRSLPPYLALHYIICLQGVFPFRN